MLLSTSNFAWSLENIKSSCDADHLLVDIHPVPTDTDVQQR